MGLTPALVLLAAALLLLSTASACCKRYRRRRLLDLQTGLHSLRALSWEAFERLVGELFRRQGYRVKQRGGAAPDGGIDLVLRQDKRKTIVQCKHWRNQAVGVSLVRELFGVMHGERAQHCIFVSTSSYTDEAQAFARGKPIRLIDGVELLQLLEAVRTQRQGNAAARTPVCPQCGRTMVRRVARQGPYAGQDFWGCSRYPACRGRRPLD